MVIIKVKQWSSSKFNNGHHIHLVEHSGYPAVDRQWGRGESHHSGLDKSKVVLKVPLGYFLKSLKYRVPQKKPSFVDMLDMMDVMAQWKLLVV